MSETTWVPDPISGSVKPKDERFFEFGKVVYSKDDTKGIIRMLKKGGYSVSGKKVFNEDGSHKGFKCSAKCRPKVAMGHNRRDPDWIEHLTHIDPYGYHKTYLDCGSLEKCYAQLFDEALEEYNKNIRKDRRIKNYLTHILEDQRRGTMKKKSTTDNSRKPWYEFVFQIGRRDNRLGTEESIALLEKFALEWMPKHYPNIKAVGIYLHADEFTIDPVTKEKLPGSVHVHFVYVPVCHALTKEEQAEEKRLRHEMKMEEIEHCRKEGIEFDEKKWNKRDWEKWRVENFGKAMQSGMRIQSSLSGACAEMGFRTKGKLTAQIQMEESVRHDLLDMVENYEIKVDRTIDEDREEEVSIQEYKSREDNKVVLEETQKLLSAVQKTEKQNKIDAAKNQKDKEQNQKDNAENKMNAEHNAEVKARNDRVSAKLSVFKDKVEEIDKNLETIKEWNEQKEKVEAQLNQVNTNQQRRQMLQDKKDKDLKERKRFLDELHDETYGQARKNEKKEEEIKSQLEELSEEKNRDERRKGELKSMADSYYNHRSDFRRYENAHDFMERSRMDIDSFEKDFYNHERYGVRSTKENLQEMFGRVKEYISHLYIKFEDAQRVWKDFFQGKKANDLRAIADDMDAHGIVSFEEYDRLRLAGKLKWQAKVQEQEIRQYVPKKKERPSIGWSD